MVKSTSAQLYLPFEQRFSVESNHTDIVKFASRGDDTYKTVVTCMEECLTEIDKRNTGSISLRFAEALQLAIEEINLEEIERLLSPPCGGYHSKPIHPIPLLDDPKFFWIFKNVDLEEWESASSGLLWLSGALECGINRAALHILHRMEGGIGGKVKTSQEIRCENTVLYFSFQNHFPLDSHRCASIGPGHCVRSLFSQFTFSLQQERQEFVARLFLRTILDSILSRPVTPTDKLKYVSSTAVEWKYSEKDSHTSLIEKILQHSSLQEQWDAFTTVTSDERVKGLSIIIDGLDLSEKSEDPPAPRTEFARQVLDFLKYLQQVNGTVKALLTSIPCDKIDKLIACYALGQLHIEHGKERQCILP